MGYHAQRKRGRLVASLTLALAAAGYNAEAGTAASSRATAPDAVRAAMMRVADWQLAHPSQYAPTDWTQAVFYAGVMALAGMAETPKYHDAMMAVGRQTGWEPGPRLYHADDHAVSQTYLDLFVQHRDPQMLAPTRARFDAILATPPDDDLDFTKPAATNKWSWCDALFMAPPAWAQVAAATGDQQYLDFMHRQWWVTTDYLYSNADHLYFRDSRFFHRREANGNKIFWSRGNGWVLAGLVRVLRVMPADYPHRPRYLTLLKDLAANVTALQGRDGLWRASLLDPATYPAPETSGTGLFVYALAWGVNHGALDAARYRPIVEKGWRGLVGAVEADGRLGWVQPIAEGPQKISAATSEVYGVGAFLLAGSEVFRMMQHGH